jgi:hypothetical protein
LNSFAVKEDGYRLLPYNDLFAVLTSEQPEERFVGVAADTETESTGSERRLDGSSRMIRSAAPFEDFGFSVASAAPTSPGSARKRSPASSGVRLRSRTLRP